MSITSPDELDGLRAIGRIVRKALDAMSAAVRPGITTAELDDIGGRALADHGAESSPPKVYGSPARCASASMMRRCTGSPGIGYSGPGI